MENDLVKPWNWATLPGCTDPVEIVSYPFPDELLGEAVMVRTRIGDPTSLRKVPLRDVEGFSRTSHGWNAREVVSCPSHVGFYFVDELTKVQLDDIIRRGGKIGQGKGT
jgi:hypothetical protein